MGGVGQHAQRAGENAGGQLEQRHHAGGQHGVARDAALFDREIGRRRSRASRVGRHGERRAGKGCHFASRVLHSPRRFVCRSGLRTAGVKPGDAEGVGLPRAIAVAGGLHKRQHLRRRRKIARRRWAR